MAQRSAKGWGILRCVVLIGGNHDGALERLGPEEVGKAIPAATYLSNTGTSAMGGRVQLWGSGYSEGHGGSNGAFQPQGAAVEEWLQAFPTCPLDVLITHGPLELSRATFTSDASKQAKSFGCRQLLDVVQSRVHPSVHVFGHDHDAHGALRVGPVLFICATSVKDGTLTAENAPIVVDVPYRAECSSAE